jgi:transposase-like protein
MDETYIKVEGEDSICIEPWIRQGRRSTFESRPNAIRLQSNASSARLLTHRQSDVTSDEGRQEPGLSGCGGALKADGAIPRRVALRQCRYLNNVIEQDHRTVRRRVWLAKGYGSFQSAWRTLQGIEAVNMIRKWRVRWLAKGDAVGQAHFIGELFGLSAKPRFTPSAICPGLRHRLPELRNETATNVNAAKTLLRKATKGQRVPTKVTLDAYAASHRALADLQTSGELSERVRLRSSKYLNNPIEQDQTATPADVGAEELRDGGGGDRRYRIGGEDEKRAV